MGTTGLRVNVAPTRDPRPTGPDPAHGSCPSVPTCRKGPRPVPLSSAVVGSTRDRHYSGVIALGRRDRGESLRLRGSRAETETDYSHPYEGLPVPPIPETTGDTETSLPGRLDPDSSRPLPPPDVPPTHPPARCPNSSTRSVLHPSPSLPSRGLVSPSTPSDLEKET